jgi:hypothetical protein
MKNWRPQPEEYARFYKNYIKSVPDGDPVELLMYQGEKQLKMLKELPSGKWDYKYAPGKWSVKEMWTHVIDTERVMAYRALRIGRKDKTDLPGFEQDAYVIESKAAGRTAESIMIEYEAVRKSSYLLFSQLSDENLLNRGTIDANVISVRALLYIILGHELHHMKVLRLRYK